VVAILTKKGEVTLPEAVQRAAGLRPGDRLEIRATESGDVLIRKGGSESFRDRVERLRRGGFKPTISSDELMRLTRDDD
jgi:AbrB family looped-hinge helix DNA binding protein